MNNQDIKKSIVKDSFWSFVSTSISRLGGIIFTIILARFLMPENYGIYALVLSSATIFYTFADLGINQTIIRYLSFAVKRKKKQISSYYWYLLKVKLILASCSSLLLLLLSYPLSHFVFKNPLLFYPLVAASFYIFVLALDMFHSMVFYAIQKVNYLSMRELFSQISRIILAILIFYFVAQPNQVIGIFLSLILSSLFLILFSLYYIKILIPNLFEKLKEKIDKGRVRRFVGFLTIASISSVFFSHIDSIMIGLFLPTEYVGYYGAAFSLVLGAMGFASFPIVPLLPLFTKINKSKKELAFNRAIKYLSIITIPAIFGLLALGKYIIKIFYGFSYLPAALPLYFLSFLLFPAVSVGIFLSLFSAEEKPQIFAKLIVIACLLNIFLNFILIKLFLRISPDWAIAGAAIATVISWFFYLTASIIAIKKEFNFSMSFYPIIKPLISSIIMFLVLFYSLRFINNTNLFIGIFAILLGILVYFSVLFIIRGITREDIALLKLVIKK